MPDLVRAADARAVMAVPGLHWHDNGQATLSGPLLGYMTRLDEAILRGATGLDAVALRPSPCLPPGVPERCGYLDSFPHHATVATPMASGAARNSEGRALLTPAACYHVYPLLEGARLVVPAVYTIRATCFRHEECFLPLERQWAFTMREIVCVGSNEDVARFLETTRATVSGWCQMLGIRVAARQATDPFFDPKSSPGWLMQRLLPLKTELVSGDLAISSFNAHQSYFGDIFDIQQGGCSAWTGCVAFGLERWLLALIRQHGREPGRWPAPEALI
jgi:seryl-tRNA synthetase